MILPKQRCCVQENTSQRLNLPREANANPSTSFASQLCLRPGIGIIDRCCPLVGGYIGNISSGSRNYAHAGWHGNRFHIPHTSS